MKNEPAKSGATELDQLMAGMQPELLPGIFAFVTVHDSFDRAGLAPLMTFREREGITLIVEMEVAQRHGLKHDFLCRMITLNVHSSLEAVGFLARITACLAEHGIGVNPVSAFYHDHLFVPVGRAEDARRLLVELSESSPPA